MMQLPLEDVTCSRAAGKRKYSPSPWVSRPIAPDPAPAQEWISWPVVVWVVPLLAIPLELFILVLSRGGKGPVPEWG